MAGDALPLSHIENPGIGEASRVVVRLAFVSPLRVIHTGNDGGVAKEIHFHVRNIGQRRLEKGIFDIGKKFLLVAEVAVPFRVDEAAGYQRIEGSGIAMHLSLVPHAFQDQQLALARIGLLGGH